MSRKHSTTFDASVYWQQRVGAGADIAVVGHRAMGQVYNSEIYTRRIEALDAMLGRLIEKPLERLRVLDIGCGNGIYTGFWQAKGISDYTGLDISGSTIAHLAEIYPSYRFVHADIGAPLPASISDGEPFDVITVFDVLYHIVDRQAYRSAISNIGRLLSYDGKLFVMDFLAKDDYRISDHVLYRARDRYFADFREHALELVETELLFHFLVPPITEWRVIDWCAAAAFNVFGRLIRINDWFAARVAATIRELDTRLRQRKIWLRNGELLVFARSAKING